MMANIITLGIKNKPVCFVLPSFFRNFANGLANLQRLGIKKKHISFVLLSTFRNFANRMRDAFDEHV